MSVSTAQQLRLLMNDRHVRQVEAITGDGQASAFQLQGYPIASGNAQSIAGSATVVNPVAPATFDYTYGVVTFAGVPSAGSAAGTAVYYHSVFADEDVNMVLSANGNNLNMCNLYFINALMGDYAKRAKWASPGGLQYDESMVMKNLMMRFSAAYKLVYDTPWAQGAGVGGVASWAETQAEY